MELSPPLDRIESTSGLLEMSCSRKEEKRPLVHSYLLKLYSLYHAKPFLNLYDSFFSGYLQLGSFSRQDEEKPISPFFNGPFPPHS